MALVYSAPQTGCLRQGDILGPVSLHRLVAPAEPLPEDYGAEIDTHIFDLMIVMHADCDLERDYESRRIEGGQLANGGDERKLLAEILLCAVHPDSDLSAHVAGGDVARRVRRNQDERFHYFSAAPIDGRPAEVPAIFLDFKKTYMGRTESLYASVLSGSIQKVACVPPYYLHDLMHRYFGYHSRVGIP